MRVFETLATRPASPATAPYLRSSHSRSISSPFSWSQMRGAVHHLWRMRLYFLQHEWPLSRALGGDARATRTTLNRRLEIRRWLLSGDLRTQPAKFFNSPQ